MDAYRLLGVRAQLIMCILRDQSPEFAMATLLESLPYRDWIIAIGLDSDEKGNPPGKFADVFRHARAFGYRLTMHCDVDQDDACTYSRVRRDHRRGPHRSWCQYPRRREARRRGGTPSRHDRVPHLEPIRHGRPQSIELRRMLEAGLKVTVKLGRPGTFPGLHLGQPCGCARSRRSDGGSARGTRTQRLRGFVHTELHEGGASLRARALRHRRLTRSAGLVGPPGRTRPSRPPGDNRTDPAHSRRPGATAIGKDARGQSCQALLCPAQCGEGAKSTDPSAAFATSRMHSRR